ncbi:MAG: methionyl-tRNA formyltransferase, partial [Pseudomonadota bacterium]
MGQNPRVIFAGTPAFALASLQALVERGVTPVAVLTQPDRPAGRGRKLTPSPVKRYAVEKGLTVMQPTTLKDPDVVRSLAELDADVMVVAAYGLLLPQAVLDLPARGCLNVHASLLPRWRGAAPIQAAILAGDTETGICLMQMEAGLDTGPVYASASVPIAPAATAGEVHDRLAALGGQLLAARLDDILCGDLVAEPQDEALSSYAPKIRPADAVIDWARSARELDRQVRAYNPVPGARFDFNG